MSIIGTDIARAARILREGEVVTFATMYAMKSHPLLLLPTRENIKWAGGDTVALRVPKHPQALQLLAAAGAVAAPSANRFGRLSPTTASHVAADFSDEKELYILDGGSCQAGIESTIVAYLNGELSLLRPG